MRSSSSDFASKAPQIPDHEMIRQIGKGSYGEVWLGRGVTGALRAIKVVSRADFEYDRTFEREFEGIRKFEPISRTHPGLVDILHVGRNLTEGFYYCVMELADDRLSGREIVPELYVARTLSSDIKEKGQIPVDACADWGAMIADALQHMHAKGLAHRDVKPSNIIFVEGVPKLADIGLVAMSGQRTFVGTEGFVPPERPGEPVADIYSLGMVLYETSTGLDRLDFPAVPDLNGDETERKKWRRLNAIVCKACAPSPKQRYSSARDLKLALKGLGSRSLDPPSVWAYLLRTAVFSGLLATGIIALRNHDLFAAYRAGSDIAQNDIAPEFAPPPIGNGPNGGSPIAGGNPDVIPPPPDHIDPPPDPDPPLPKFGSVKIVTNRGAKIYRVVEGGEKILAGEARPDFFDGEVAPGVVVYDIALEGHKTLHVNKFVEAGKLTLIEGVLQFYQPPLEGQPWKNSKGMHFEFSEGRHVSNMPVPVEVFREYLVDRAIQGEDEKIAFDRAVVTLEGGDPEEIFETVKVKRQVAREFFSWLTLGEEGLGYLAEDQYYTLDDSVAHEAEVIEAGSGFGFEDRFPLFASVREQNYASLKINSEPQGATIWIDGDNRGTTMVDVPSVPPGEIEVTVELAGYRRQVHVLNLEPGQHFPLEVTLQKSMGVVFGSPWANGLGMRMLPLGDGVMMAARETRVRDFEAYCAEARIKSDHSENYEQGPDHPVVKVSRADAEAFCVWLTERERGEGLIFPEHEYRLPTDREWSRAAGLPRESGETPAARDAVPVKGVFPWGDQWPPPKGVANIADNTARSWLDVAQVMTGYDDGFAQTSPVGSFEPNDLGFFDLAGNVWEWIAEPYGGTSRTFQDFCVARGGGFDSADEAHFLSSYRNLQKPDTRDTIFGFRVVLAQNGRTLD